MDEKCVSIGVIFPINMEMKSTYDLVPIVVMQFDGTKGGTGWMGVWFQTAKITSVENIKSHKLNDFRLIQQQRIPRFLVYHFSF